MSSASTKKSSFTSFIYVSCLQAPMGLARTMCPYSFPESGLKPMGER